MTSAPAITLSSGSPGCTLHHPAAIQPITAVSATVSPLELCRESLRNSLEFPPLRECVIPGDRVALVPDLECAELPQLLAAVLEVLNSVDGEGVSPVLILPADPAGQSWDTLRAAWPESLRKIPVVLHDPNDRTLVSYVASTEAGERIYLNREAAEADVFITVGLMRFDSVYGVRGGMSAAFPGLSDAETVQRLGFSGFDRFRSEKRGVRRELVDEISSLLGIQYSVQLIPGANGAAAVYSGLASAVQSAGTAFLEKHWVAKPRGRAELALLSTSAAPPFAWSVLGEALEKAVSWIEDGGRIAVVADLPQPSGPAYDIVRHSRDPQDAAVILRRHPLVDGMDMLRLLAVSQRVRVYVLSGLPSDVFEELGLFHLADVAELQRLVDQSSSCVVLPNAAVLRSDR
ncbi:MAG: lactate racemase domain-containing protein [Planctomycetaceae bacterium]